MKSKRFSLPFLTVIYYLFFSATYHEHSSPYCLCTNTFCLWRASQILDFLFFIFKEIIYYFLNYLYFFTYSYTAKAFYSSSISVCQSNNRYSMNRFENK